MPTSAGRTRRRAHRPPRGQRIGISGRAAQGKDGDQDANRHHLAAQFRPAETGRRPAGCYRQPPVRQHVVGIPDSRRILPIQGHRQEGDQHQREIARPARPLFGGVPVRVANAGSEGKEPPDVAQHAAQRRAIRRQSTGIQEHVDRRPNRQNGQNRNGRSHLHGQGQVGQGRSQRQSCHQPRSRRRIAVRRGIERSRVHPSLQPQPDKGIPAQRHRVPLQQLNQKARRLCGRT